MKTDASKPDFLDRDDFLKALHHHIEGLAEIPSDHLPAPRVLAVDAPWGYGKSWIANRLHTELQDGPKPRPVAYIDAFRYDHHDDVFAVIAAAVMKALRPEHEKREKYLRTAANVLKAAAPALMKAATGLALKVANLDADDVSEAWTKVSDAATESVGKSSEKAVEQLFEAYSKTQQLQEDFQSSLEDLTKDLPHPFVVIIDELDRCRPSFALEVLERIKHLFAAKGVVFVLFWNARSIRESVRHTYGRGADAEGYLSKFVALSITLLLSSKLRPSGPSGYVRFIEQELARVVSGAYDRAEFQATLTECAALFNASLRDVQKAIGIYAKGAETKADCSTPEFAYLCLLRVTDSETYLKLIDGDPKTAASEAGRFPVPNTNSVVNIPHGLWMALSYRADPDRFDELAGTGTKGINELDDMLIDRLAVGKPGGRTRWLDQAGNLINDLLTTRRYGN